MGFGVAFGAEKLVVELRNSGNDSLADLGN